MMQNLLQKVVDGKERQGEEEEEEKLEGEKNEQERKEAGEAAILHAPSCSVPLPTYIRGFCEKKTTRERRKLLIFFEIPIIYYQTPYFVINSVLNKQKEYNTSYQTQHAQEMR